MDETMGGGPPHSPAPVATTETTGRTSARRRAAPVCSRQSAGAGEIAAYHTGGQLWSLEAATWDASGHPAALWGWSLSNSEGDGLWRHAP